MVFLCSLDSLYNQPADSVGYNRRPVSPQKCQVIVFPPPCLCVAVPPGKLISAADTGLSWKSVTCRCQMREARQRALMICLVCIVALFHTSPSFPGGAVVYPQLRLHLRLCLVDSCETKEMAWNSILWPLCERRSCDEAAITWLSFFLSFWTCVFLTRRLSQVSASTELFCYDPNCITTYKSQGGRKENSCISSEWSVWMREACVSCCRVQR